MVRAYLEKRLKNFLVAGIETERKGDTLKLIIKTARPGMIIGRQGEGSVKLKDDVIAFLMKHKLAVKELKIDIEEVRFPESNAAVVGHMIREALEKRLPFRRVMKQTLDKVMANKEVKGVRIGLSGRLGGAEMSREEELKKGTIPLQTFRADVDFARERAILPYGTLGIKVWIYKGEIFAEKGKKEMPQKARA